MRANLFHKGILRRVRTLGLVLCSAATATVQAQLTPTTNDVSSAELPVVELGPHYRICAAPDTNSTAVAPGRVAPKHTTIEMASGLNFYDPVAQKYRPSEPRFELSADGSAFVAERVLHKVRLNGNLNAVGAVQVLAPPDGTLLQSTPVAIGILDRLTGSSTLIGVLTNSTPIQVAENEIEFANAFAGGVCASVDFRVEKGSFHQNVIFTGKLDPADFGFSTNHPLRIQIWTEFYNVPAPDLIVRPVFIEPNPVLRQQLAVPDLIDTTIGFGEFVLGNGWAFTDPAPGETQGAAMAVAKEFKTIGGRVFLIESVDYAGAIAKGLASLPDCGPAAGSASVGRGNKNRYASLPPLPPARQPKANLRLAANDKRAAKPSGVLVDYIATVNGTLTGSILFSAETNYFVSGPLFCNAATTLEGGVVFKFQTNAYMQLNNTLTLKTSPWRVATFSGVDDDSVGSSLTNWPGSYYTGTINTNGYANPAISTAQLSLTISNCSFRYAKMAVNYSGSPGNQNVNLTVNHSQFFNCIQGISIINSGCGSASGSMVIAANNVLMCNVTYPFNYPSSAANLCAMANCTVDHSSYLISGGATVNAFNSIFANVTNSSSITSGSDKNGFYNSPQHFGTSQFVVTSSPFVSVGAGNYYLSAASGFLGAGSTANIPSWLPADLRQRTTYPPTVFAQTPVTNDMSLIQQVSRDTGTSPALGFHYLPLDYCFGLVNVSNSATITINPGTVIGGFAFPTNKTYSLNFGGGAKLSSQGAPTNLVRLVPYNVAQEQPVSTWSEPVQDGLVTDAASVTSAGGYNLRFTDIASPAADVLGINVSTAVANLQDCQVHGGNLEGFIATMNLTNCLLERVYTTLYSYDGNIPGIRDSTFYGGTLDFEPGVTNAVIKDNLFDQTSMYYSPSSYNGGHNAFVTNCSKSNCCLLYPTNASDLILSNSPAYQSSWFGNYYLPSSSTLVDAGSTTANLVGLFQYTTQTNQTLEASSVVDIGYHSIATDSNGNPIDSNGDGIPNYLSDLNGNGITDPGEVPFGITIDNPLDRSVIY